MKYLLILTVLLCLALKGFCGKKTSQAVALIGDAFRFNFTRMLFCLIIASLQRLQSFLRVKVFVCPERLGGCAEGFLILGGVGS